MSLLFTIPREIVSALCLLLDGVVSALHREIALALLMRGYSPQERLLHLLV